MPSEAAIYLDAMDAGGWPPPAPQWAISRMDGATGYWDGPNLRKDWKNPDGAFIPYTNDHDWAYAWGGSLNDKFRADLKLGRDVAKSGHPVHGAIMFAGLTLFGWVNWFRSGRKAKRVRRLWAKRNRRNPGQ